MVGSRPFMAPEQIMGKSERRSDIWAIGVLMYLLYTGELPFYVEVEKLLIDMILEQEPEPPRSLNPEIPAPLEAIILKCLKKDVEERYPHARALKEDLLRVGRCRVRVLHTPGHTEGSVCYVLDDEAALTGDFIFVESIGRPDLAGRTVEWTGDLWQSVETAKHSWPPATIVYPAHYASNGERRNDGVVAAFNDTVGLEWLRLLHLNDSMHPLGSRRDRHAHIAAGTLGERPFRRLMTDDRLLRVPKLLETPKDDDALLADRENLARLRGYRVAG